MRHNKASFDRAYQEAFMSKRRVIFLLFVVFCLEYGIVQSGLLRAAEIEMTPEQLVAEHLKSIGKPEAISGIRSRVLSGISMVQFIQGGKGGQKGEFAMASDSRKLGILMKYSAAEYSQEHFTFDGDKVTVSYISPGQRSPLADFIYRYNGPVKEGLLGGILSVGWPLLDLKAKQATLRLHEATIDGKKLYEVEYLPKKSFGDAKVKLYFDCETYRHVRTEYAVRVRNDTSALPSVKTGTPRDDISRNQTTVSERERKATVMDNQADSIYKLVEKFEDFQQVGGLMLPFTYSLDYSVEGSGATFIARWVNKSNGQFTNNAQIGAEFFQAQK
jgi:hypothetical protein